MNGHSGSCDAMMCHFPGGQSEQEHSDQESFQQIDHVFLGSQGESVEIVFSFSQNPLPMSDYV
jgi:hypothetical protein